MNNTYQCKSCQASFASNEILMNHEHRCDSSVPVNKSRRKSCLGCAESKVKCDLAQPCSKCVSRGKACLFVGGPQELPAKNTKGRIPSNQLSFHNPPQQTADILEPTFTVTSPSDPSPIDPVAIPLHAFSEYTPWDALNITYSSGAAFSNLYDDAGSSNSTQPLENVSDLPSSFQGMDSQCMASLLSGSYPSFAPTGQHIAVSSKPSLFSNNLEEPTANDLQKYLDSFCTSFLNHIPIIKPLVWELQRQCPSVINVVYACGALFYQHHEPKAAQLVDKALMTYRGPLASEFGQSISNGDNDTTCSIIFAMSLLQHLGCLSVEARHREAASLYHGMLINMIKRSGMMNIAASCAPPSMVDSEQLDSIWRDWVKLEMVRRCVFWAFVQDCCQSIYFSSPPGLETSDLTFSLPCDDEVWKAESSQEWARVLSKPSAYGTGRSRINVITLQDALRNIMAVLKSSQEQKQEERLNPGAYFILIHALLRKLYDVGAGIDKATMSNVVSSTHFALHNWLKQWLDSQECMVLVQDSASGVDEVYQIPFCCNVLPFYWLAQVTLSAIQEGIPVTGAKFIFEAPGDEQGNSALKEMKEWMAKVTASLRAGHGIPIELMQVRLQYLSRYAPYQ
ncbi:hypothetical protein DL96DRAFT_1537091 [Flagelloscypha sp. PMI_526]|nr:hypothetical protein DL96DRAFT_1537091 [Flagelloscypha sp. PMI_526]